MSTQPTLTYILLEDDYYTSLRLKRMMQELRPAYRLVGESESARHAGTLLATQQADLILSDICLADATVFAAMRQADCHKPVIFLSGYDRFRDNLEEFNVVDFLLKPISLSDLSQSILKFENLQQ